VRTLPARLRADDVPIVEEHEESTYVAFKCLDPGGHRVEGYYGEPVRSASRDEETGDFASTAI
jgi:hypothetical protein